MRLRRPTLCALFAHLAHRGIRFAQTPRMALALFLIVSNFFVGYGGMILFAFIARIAHNGHWIMVGLACYALSWGMLIIGSCLAGSKIIEIRKLFSSSWCAWKRLRQVTPLLIAVLLLNGCASVLPPNRPVAYMYPSVMKMADLNQFSSKYADEATVKDWLKQAGADKYLQNYGFLESDYSVLVRGLKSRGYAEIDARHCKKCPVRWIYMAFKEEDVLVGIRFDSLPPEDVLQRSTGFGKNTECIIKLKRQK